MKTALINSPIGLLRAGAVEGGLLYLLFEDQPFPKKLKELSLLSDAPGSLGFSRAEVHLERLTEQLLTYFEGTNSYFSIPSAVTGTPFQERVWQIVSLVQPVDTISYAAVSKLLGDAGSVRAVARANAENPLVLLMPCHRVIGSGGALTGYSGGLERKAWLLEHERKMTGKSVPTLF